MPNSANDSNDVDNQGARNDIYKNCKHCDERIRQNATVCPICQGEQNRYFRFAAFLQPILQPISIAISLLLIILSSLTYLETRDNRLESEEALAEAEEAQETATLAQQRSQEVLDRSKRLENQLLKLTKRTQSDYEKLQDNLTKRANSLGNDIKETAHEMQDSMETQADRIRDEFQDQISRIQTITSRAQEDGLLNQEIAAKFTEINYYYSLYMWIEMLMITSDQILVVGNELEEIWEKVDKPNESNFPNFSSFFEDASLEATKLENEALFDVFLYSFRRLIEKKTKEMENILNRYQGTTHRAIYSALELFLNLNEAEGVSADERPSEEKQETFRAFMAEFFEESAEFPESMESSELFEWMYR